MTTTTRILAATAIALAVAAAPAGAATKSCPAKKGTLAKNNYGRVWHKGSSLYACTTVYGHRPRARRMGPYKSATKVSFDGVNLAWTVPLTRDGVRSDRVWAANADDGSRWLEGKRLVPAAGDQPEREARVLKLLAVDRAAAWVTRSGEVGFALESPESAPEAIGTLPAPLTPDDKRLLVGGFGAAAAPQLAATLKLTEGDGDGDECGGSNPYQLTFAPAGATVGATWWGGWTSTNC